jgi:iron complex transport system permease protein
MILISKIPFVGGLMRHSWPPVFESIIIYARLPRVIMSALVGLALSTSGAVLQGLFRNPLADPYVLGISSGAAFGASLAILGVGYGFGLGMYSLPIFAFLFATLTVFLVYNIARVHQKVLVETALLAGIAVGAFFNAMVAFSQFIAGERLEEIVFWIMGGLSATQWNQVVIAIPPIMLGTFLILLFSRDLNAMLSGEEVALSLGVNVETVKKTLLFLTSLVVATAVSVSGIIGFVGLIIPHIMRDIVGPDHRILLPSSCLAGAIFLIWADTLARVIISPAELPVGIITACIGAPFFIYLLRKRKRMMGW